MVARRVALAGATGLVGRAILDGLLADEEVEAVHVLARRDIGRSAAKLTVRRVDFATVAPLPPVDEVYLALGTTIKVAGSQAALPRRRLRCQPRGGACCARCGCEARGLVSAMGADPKSLVFYSRVKGELEEALGSLPFEGLVLARPSLLVGDRMALGQPTRTGEVFGEVVGRLLGPLVPRDYRPIAATAVARALLVSVPRVQGREVLRSGAMNASP
jgi:uncharacterized protein YbjT (DUF2867 family)